MAQNPDDHMLRIMHEGLVVEIVCDDAWIRSDIAEKYRLFAGNRRRSRVCGRFVLRTESGRYRLSGPSNYYGDECNTQRLGSNERHSASWFLGSALAAHFVSVSKKSVWFHSGAAEKDGAAVLILGPRASGKSTLSTTLVQEHGFSYLSDELVPINCDDGMASPFPIRPTRRIPVAEAAGVTCPEQMVKEDVDISNASCGRSIPRLLVFSRFQPGTTVQMRTATAGEAFAHLCSNVIPQTPDNGFAASLAMRLAESVPAAFCVYGEKRIAASSLHNVFMKLCGNEGGAGSKIHDILGRSPASRRCAGAKGPILPAIA